MGTVYDAIELCSANLYEQVRMLAARRGWGTRPYAYLLSPRPMHFITFTATTVHLPGGLGASFTPRSAPAGAAWVIDVRRTDGKVPRGAERGLMVVEGGTEGWQLCAGSAPLTDSALGEMLEDLAA
jgi:hypothetical protein